MADFTGTSDNDTLSGTAGADNLYGLGGNDVYLVNHVADAVFEAINAGEDRVLASVSWTLGAASYVEKITTNDNLATTAINLTGNELAQYIYGNVGANILDGGGGGDVLIGLGGDDFYYIRNIADRVVEAVGGGNDRVFAAASFALEAGSEVEKFTTVDNLATTAINLTGNGLAQYIYGNAGANILDGGGGGDVLVGLGGDDFYYIRNAADRVVEAAGGGNDRVFAAANFTLEAGSEVEKFTTVDNLATTAINLTGNELAQYIYGNAGANILDGGGGGDVMVGLDGDDTYYIRNAADRVVETAGGGADRVFAAASFILEAGSQVEVFTTVDNLATTAINLTGNELAQYIYGNAGANTIRGGAGADVLTGLGGADAFVFDAALAPSNIDRITDFVAGLDQLRLAGQAGEPFGALASGTLAASSFVIGATAAQADDYILYDSSTGALLYDVDGNGAGTAVQFATLSTGLSLTAADFVISGPANNAPTVTSSASASVAENSDVGTVVYQAVATDADGDRITWTLGGTDAGYLTIDAVTGAVRLISPADFETKTSYAFSVTAADSAATGAAKQVTLSVTDVADSNSTPIINEANAANDGTGAAQPVDRNTFTVSANGDLPDPSLPSATIRGSVSSNNDVDFYSITLQAGEKIVLDVDHTTNSLDSFIRFYGSDGIEFVNNDDKNSPDTGSNPPFDHNTDSYLTYRVSSAGTYYFSIESFGDLNNDQDDDGPNVGESSGSYSLNVSIGPPATAAQIMDEDIDALISGSQWDHTALTYGFPTDVSQYPSGIKETNPASDFSPFTGNQQTITGQLLQLVANVSSLTFQQLSANPGSADMRYAMSSEAGVAYAYYPTNVPNSIGGTAWFNKTDFNNPIKGNYAWMGILHETGHALGLKHGHEAPAVSSDHDSLEYTVMTYRSYPGDNLNGYTNEQWGYPQSLMMLDIAALQRIYGANFNTNSGSSVYSWSATTGEMSINGVGQGGANNGAGGSASRIFMTIWDGGGNDTYDLSNYSSHMTIDLRPGEWSTFGNGQRANLGSSHLARGNVANALLYQGNTASLIEDAIGGSGPDILIANQAANHLTGNGEVDVFRWMAGTDAGTGALADTIMDFVRGSDNINLSSVDANSNTGAQEAFHFIGTAAFTSTAGELRYDVTGGNAHIFGDRDGNGVADMEIIVNNVTVLATTDFNGVTGSANLVDDLGGNGPAYIEPPHHLVALGGADFFL